MRWQFRPRAKSSQTELPSELLRDPGGPGQLTLVLCREGLLEIKPEVPYANRMFAPVPSRRQRRSGGSFPHPRRST